MSPGVPSEGDQWAARRGMPTDPPNDRGRVSDRLSVMCGPATEDRVEQVEFNEVRLDYTIPASRRFLSRTNRWSPGTWAQFDGARGTREPAWQRYGETHPAVAVNVACAAPACPQGSQVNEIATMPYFDGAVRR
jgi:hypothetical protein